MHLYTIHRKQILNTTVENAWHFFSMPDNLNDITPPNMHLHTISNSGSDRAFAGQLITYTVKPFLGIPFFWMTEITHLSPNDYFVDEQRYGPYKFWHHLHRFKQVPGGVEMEDMVHYVMPYGIIGRMAHALFVGKQLQQVFDYRRDYLQKVFK